MLLQPSQCLRWTKRNMQTSRAGAKNTVTSRENYLPRLLMPRLAVPLPQYWLEQAIALSRPYPRRLPVCSRDILPPSDSVYTALHEVANNALSSPRHSLLACTAAGPLPAARRPWPCATSCLCLHRGVPAPSARRSLSTAGAAGCAPSQRLQATRPDHRGGAAAVALVTYRVTHLAPSHGYTLYPRQPQRRRALARKALAAAASASDGVAQGGQGGPGAAVRQFVADQFLPLALLVGMTVGCALGPASSCSPPFFLQAMHCRMQ